MGTKMNVLMSNDDGVDAPGIHAFAEEVSKMVKLTVVAPEREKSTTGHSLTLHKPLRLKKLPNGFFRCSGAPADCVYLGHNKVMSRKTDFVLSGVNRGANLGQDVFYSGTVSAAREASNLGIPSMAVSLCLDHHRASDPIRYDVASRVASDILKDVLSFYGRGKEQAGLKRWPKGMLLNVNVPNLPYGKIRGYRVGTQGKRYYSGKILERTDARDRRYYWIGGTYQGFENIEGSDCWLVDKGFVSITPLELDTTMKPVFLELAPHFSK